MAATSVLKRGKRFLYGEKPDASALFAKHRALVEKDAKSEHIG